MFIKTPHALNTVKSKQTPKAITSLSWQKALW